MPPRLLSPRRIRVSLAPNGCYSPPSTARKNAFSASTSLPFLLVPAEPSRTCGPHLVPGFGMRGGERRERRALRVAEQAELADVLHVAGGPDHRAAVLPGHRERPVHVVDRDVAEPERPKVGNRR
jgi:hypothetical protein